MSGDPRRHRHTGGRPITATLRPVARVLAALLSFTVLVGFGYGWYEYRSLNNGVHKFHLSNLGQAPGGAPSKTTKGHEQNILLVGLDTRDGLSAKERSLLRVGGGGSLATDTILVLHVPADGSRATLISIPRDSYVDIPHYAKNKINAAYADAYSDAAGSGASVTEAEAAGANLLVETVSQLTGLRIDHYVQVGFGGFYKIAQALKSIPVTLCAATDDTQAHNRSTGQSGGSGFKMSAGHHDLTPLQALEFVRQRHNLKGGDIAREKRQRYFLAAAFNKIASAGVLLDPGKLNNLIKAVTGAFYVDDDNFSLVGFANQLIDLNANKITGDTIPTQGTHDVSVLGNTTSGVIVDPAQVQRYVAARLNAPTPAHTSTPARPSSSTGTSTAPAQPVAKGCIY
jgi:LCP family protein required for cell wall assembly